MCLSPFIKKNEHYQGPWQKRYYLIPCGKCEECVKRLQNDWFVRCKAELNDSLCGFFVTLTYSDDHLTFRNGVPILVKDDLVKFFKRFRQALPFQLRYLACGEYGGQSGRPHYHFNMFVPPDPALSDWVVEKDKLFNEMLRLIHKEWSKGNVRLDYINDARIRYVVKYMLKSDGDMSNAASVYQPPFRLVSKGLGKCAVTDRTWNGVDEMTFNDDGGVKYPYPRYYRDKAFQVDPALEIEWKRFIDDRNNLSFAEAIRIQRSKIRTAQGSRFRLTTKKTVL